MTSETRTLIEMTDIIGVEFECKKCAAKIFYPFQQHYERLADKCPNCYEPWFLDDPMRPPHVTPPADEVKKIFATFRNITKSPLVLAQVRLCISGLPKSETK